jgi:hypothetical protein
MILSNSKIQLYYNVTKAVFIINYPRPFFSVAIRRATKMAGQAVANASKKHWKDMGLFTLTIYGYIKPTGKITVET